MKKTWKKPIVQKQNLNEILPPQKVSDLAMQMQPPVEQIIPTEKFAELKPAVTFSKGYAYTLTDAVPCPLPYGPVVTANNYIQGMVEGFDSNDVASRYALWNISDTNARILSNGLGTALDNIVNVFKVRVFTLLGINITEDNFREYLWGSVQIYDIDNFIKDFFKASPQEQEFILNHTLSDFILSQVTRIGTQAYFYAMKDVNDRLALIVIPDDNIEEGKDTVATIMFEIQRAFCLMMGDMTYEAGVFVDRFKNLVNGLAYINDAPWTTKRVDAVDDELPF